MRHLEGMLANLSADELGELAHHLVTMGSAGRRATTSTRSDDPSESGEPGSRRRPGRPDVVTYRVRVDVDTAKPPIWRRLDLASDMFLDALHEVIQIAFGWQDSHLHRFSTGSPFDPDAESYLSDVDLEEGDDGIPESEARLDELLVEPGDTLAYTYDYGDDWRHTIRLEAVSDRAPGDPRAVCVDGRRAGPTEDSGGVHGYQEKLAIVADPSHPDHQFVVAWMIDQRGHADLDPVAFDIDAINTLLLAITAPAPAGDSGSEPPAAETIPAPVARLLALTRGRPGGRMVHDLVEHARLDAPVLVDTAVAAATVHRYTWLLGRVGDDGIKLTAAGYLPPVHVEAAVHELGMTDEWIGKGNREDLTAPVLQLRMSAQRLGLVRKYRGRLQLTKRGDATRRDPVRLWWQLAELMPAASPQSIEADAGLVMLLAAAAGHRAEPGGAAAQLVECVRALGWAYADGSPLDTWAAQSAAAGTEDTLWHLGVYERSGAGTRSRHAITPQGVMFARAALRTWPHTS
jgi:hypothetical protein